MERIREGFRHFEYKGILVITLVFVAIACVLFAERSGIQYPYNRMRLDFLPADAIVTKEDAAKDAPVTALVLWNSENDSSAEAWAQFAVLFEDMKIGHTLVDIAQMAIPALEGYESVIVLLYDLSVLGERINALCDWVYEGGNVLFAMPLQGKAGFSGLEEKLGILASSDENASFDAIYIEDGFMLGGGRAYPISSSFDSAVTVQLTDSDATSVYVYSDDVRRLPLIWESRYGEGKFVIDNLGFYEKSMRGFYAASYSLLGDVGVYPVINGSVFYLDDFPSQIPQGDNTDISRDYGTTLRDFYVHIWWPDMMNLADTYDFRFTGLAIATYNDATDGTTDALADEATFLHVGNMLMRRAGEIAYHGYNHQPLCLADSDYDGLYDYKAWASEDAMKLAFDELVAFCDKRFPEVQMRLYVPPSDLLSDAGRAFLLREYPQIRTISGVYLAEDDKLAVYCTQEYAVNEDGVVDQPRIVSGGVLDADMQIAALSELNFHYINSHFTHPDDAWNPERGAALGWEALMKRFDDYLSWLYTAAPHLRNFTGSEMSAAVQRFCAVNVEKERIGEQLMFYIGNFHDEAQLMARFNDGTPTHISGGTMEHLTGDLYLITALDDTVTVTIRGEER